jgi:hypothetical protein
MSVSGAMPFCVLTAEWALLIRNGSTGRTYIVHSREYDTHDDETHHNASISTKAIAALNLLIEASNYIIVNNAS